MTFNQSTQHWLFLCGSLFLIGLIAVLLVYYPFSSKIWKYRFRIICGIDHIGPLLEIFFLCLVLGVVWVLGSFVYPETGTTIINQIVNREGTPLSWFLLATAILLIAVNSYTCFYNGPKEILEELKTDYSELYNELVEDGSIKKQMTKLRIGYIPYYFYGIASWLGFGLMITLIFVGFYTDIHSLQEFTNRFQNVNLINTTDLIAEANRQTIYFSSYQERLLDVVIRIVGATALILLTFVWFLGTNFQKIYTPTVVNLCRYAALFTLFSIPIVVLVFYAWFYIWERNISVSFTDAALHHCNDAQISPTLLSEFNKAHNEYLTRVSQYNFWLRLSTSWAGVLLVLEYLFAFVQKRLGNQSFFDGLRPRISSPLGRWIRAIFLVDNSKA